MFRRLLLTLLVVLPAFAQLTREPNTTLRLPVTPGGFGYRFDDAFPGLSFTNPVVITAPPGETNRLFIVEQRGRIIVITNLAAPTRTVFLDLTARTLYGGEQGMLGLAFHPNYANNGQFFVFRTLNTAPPGVTPFRHDRLSRFEVLFDDPDHADPDSEVMLFQEMDDANNHNAGDLHFGPDGYLYVTLGDEGGANDNNNNSQRIDKDFFAGLLRIDVDKRPGSLPPNPHGPPSVSTNLITDNYAVPPDNPYVGATNFNGLAINPNNVRTEFWAVGLRNPWRFSFDSANGELWIGDVGQDRWESVTVSRKAANHGWAFREGNIAGPKAGAMPSGFLTNPVFNHVPPVYVYAHGTGPTQGNSISGGFVYRGNRLAQLHGAYIYADYVSGNVWALWRQPGGAPRVQRLLGQGNISAFGADPRNGDVLAAGHTGNRILRLTYSDTFTGEPLPETLADTGAFADLASLTPSPGLVPYLVNQSFWSDYAAKQRWFSVPDPHHFLRFNTNDAWESPAGTVWVKHFELELTNGVPESARRLETRFLVRNGAGIYGVTYRWNSPTNATLVPEEGAEETLNVVRDGQTRTQVWRYPGRAQCLTCHNPQAGFSLSFNTPQLNRDQAYGGGAPTNQIAALIAAGYFESPPVERHRLPLLAHPTNELASVEWRARSYLAVNCAPCHRPGGAGGGQFDARLGTPTDLTGLVNGTLNDNRGDADNRVLVPGEATHSVLLQRLGVRGPGQMPPLASNEADPTGADLITRWIEALMTPPAGGIPNFTSALQTSPGQLHLTLKQPANYAIRIEATASLTLPNWVPVDAPGTEPFFPASDRTLEVEVTPGADAQYFRALTFLP